jgi:DNA-binding transcriptional regulator GbsR (MarR family)
LQRCIEIHARQIVVEGRGHFDHLLRLIRKAVARSSSGALAAGTAAAKQQPRRLISVLTETTEINKVADMKLTPIAERFILHWGEMGSRWGVNRTVAQIHALLYLLGRPIAADEIADTLGVARSNVSTSLKELQSWRLAKVVHVMGDRRDHFETSTDIWELFKLIVEGRRQREIDPTLTMLRDTLANAELANESRDTEQRIRDTLQFLETLTTWSDEMLRLKPETLMKTLGMGAKISRTVRRTKS